MSKAAWKNRTNLNLIDYIEDSFYFALHQLRDLTFIPAILLLQSQVELAKDEAVESFDKFCLLTFFIS